MALMDAYGLSLVSVEVWGLLWGVLSAGFIVGGLVIARWGLGRNPVRTLLLVNMVLWVDLLRLRAAGRRSCCSPSGCSCT